MNRPATFALIALTSVLALPSMAAAQATRTWVSGVGDDVNPCSRTAPCKTFAGAISKTAAPHAPWIVVPANAKWYRNLVVAQSVVEALRRRRKDWKKQLDKMGRERRAELAAHRAGTS